MNYQQLIAELTSLYEVGEAKAIVRLLLEERFGLTMTDIVCDGVEAMAAERQAELRSMMDRLLTGEPVQYVIGTADFMGRQFVVAPDVLIPRPETAELCASIIDRYNQPYCALQPPAPLKVLDVGTGSGCIAVTLALDLWNSDVSAWDISGDALLIARENAQRMGAKVNLELHDILATDIQSTTPQHFDIIVSNPPYICKKERVTMERHVLDFEPSTALFVPDDNPLLFYHAIARFAAHALKPNGLLAFEINPLYAAELMTWLKENEWNQVEVKADQFGKQRFIFALNHA